MKLYWQRAALGIAASCVLGCGPVELPDELDALDSAAPPWDAVIAPERRDLRVELPFAPSPGRPALVLVHTEGERLGPSLIMKTDDQPLEIGIYRGRGSAVVPAPSEGPLLLWGGDQSVVLGWRDVEERPTRALSGTLSGDQLHWGALRDTRLSATVKVPAGATLVIDPGARVLLDGEVSLEVEGELWVQGNATAPVAFLPAGEAPWGSLRLLEGSAARLDHAWLLGGGGDPRLAFGHSNSQPVLRVKGARLDMIGGGVLDSPGKAFGTSDAQITLRDVLVSRCDTGGEFVRTRLDAEGVYFVEIPDADGVVADDDNDAIYLRDALVDEAGEPAESTLRGCVFAKGEDDGIDHNEALVRVEGCWIEGFVHEGIAASEGREITVVDSVVRDCAQGIEAGYGTPSVVVERCLITGCEVGLRFGDSYDWGADGSLTVRESVVFGNQRDTRNWANARGGPKEGAIAVECSLVGDEELAAQADNIAGPPQGAWERGCASAPRLSAACGGRVPGPSGFSCP